MHRSRYTNIAPQHRRLAYGLISAGLTLAHALPALPILFLSLVSLELSFPVSFSPLLRSPFSFPTFLTSLPHLLPNCFAFNIPQSFCLSSICFPLICFPFYSSSSLVKLTPLDSTLPFSPPIFLIAFFVYIPLHLHYPCSSFPLPSLRKASSPSPVSSFTSFASCLTLLGWKEKLEPCKRGRLQLSTDATF